MAKQDAPLIDMTPDGRIIDPPKPTLAMILVRLAAFAIFIAVGALVFWTMIFILPVLLVLGVIGYFVARSQMRRYRQF